MKTRIFNILAAATVALASLVVLPLGKAHASFNQSNLMSDGMFENSGTMMSGDIDAFLNRYSNSCISPNSGFSAKIPSGYSPSGGFTFGDFGTAGQVIA